MSRFLACFIAATSIFAGPALSAERPLPDPEILKWQAEAQSRERALNRRVEYQLAVAQKARLHAATTPSAENPPQPALPAPKP